jgi:DNA-binding transcriptional MerR regulator
MRIAELSRRAAVPTPTLKYYLREGLLPAGDRTGPNQAQYGDAHVRRVRLIRAMLDVGGLSIAAIRELLATIDGATGDVHDVLGIGACAPAVEVDDGDAPATAPTGAEVECLLADRGWAVERGGPALTALTAVIGTLRALDQDDILDRLGAYADAAEAIARIDLAVVGARPDVDSMVEGVVIGNVLGDRLIAALRRLAQESISAETFAGRPAPGR